MPFVTSDDHIRIFFEQRGSGPAVVLSHGFRASSAMWQAQMDALSDSYQVIAWDMRGHGRSDSPADPALYSLEASVPDIRVVMHACGVDRAAIGGLSLGGFVSLAFHLAYPENATALLLFDTCPSKRRPPDERTSPTDGESLGFFNTRRGALE